MICPFWQIVVDLKKPLLGGFFICRDKVFDLMISQMVYIFLGICGQAKISNQMFDCITGKKIHHKLTVDFFDGKSATKPIGLTGRVMSNQSGFSFG